jgi:hypothetical protein
VVADTDHQPASGVGGAAAAVVMGFKSPSVTPLPGKPVAKSGHRRSLIEEPNVAWPEIELSRPLPGQVLIRQFGYRIGRNALPDLRDHLLRTAVTTNESDLARAPCGDLTRVGGIPGMAVRQYACRHDRHARDSETMGVCRLEA